MTRLTARLCPPLISRPSGCSSLGRVGARRQAFTGRRRRRVWTVQRTPSAGDDDGHVGGATPDSTGFDGHRLAGGVEQPPADHRPLGVLAAQVPLRPQRRDPAADDLGLAPWPQVDFEKYGDVERVERSRIGRLGAANLARNWVRIPHVTHHEDADITELEAFRKQLNTEQSDVKVTMVSLLLIGPPRPSGGRRRSPPS
ncbi:MAG: 2-oxo acid dehydrogenase subunit E2 [Actinobacteria bacterium]|nr:2-oxo acid dehydrogenase subunit E2 [Actinomycetota bacterium]